MRALRFTLAIVCGEPSPCSCSLAVTRVARVHSLCSSVAGDLDLLRALPCMPARKTCCFLSSSLQLGFSVTAKKANYFPGHDVFRMAMKPISPVVVVVQES